MYRTIDTSLWDDPKVKKLEPLAKLLFMYLITNRHAHVSGIYYLPPILAAHETGLTAARLDTLLNTLSGPGLARFDRETSVVWVRRMFFYQGKGEKNQRAAANHLATLHNSPLINDFIALYPAVKRHVKDRVSDTPSGVGTQEQEQEQEQKQSPKTETATRVSARLARTEFEEDFALWSGTLPNGSRDRVKPTDKRWAKYKACRKDSTREEIREALQGWPFDPWEERKEHNDFAVLLRDRSQVEKFSRLFRENRPPEGPQLKDGDEHTVTGQLWSAALGGWVDPSEWKAAGAAH